MDFPVFNIVSTVICFVIKKFTFGTNQYSSSSAFKIPDITRIFQMPRMITPGS
jgi:hypothetical protein